MLGAKAQEGCNTASPAHNASDPLSRRIMRTQRPGHRDRHDDTRREPTPHDAVHVGATRSRAARDRASDRIRIAPAIAGIERAEALLHGQAFSPHRHDTYAIGLTLSGVQSFRFRGQRWHCLPGQAQILHPDELHDGGSGTGDAFGYRIVYVDPSLVQDALPGQPLPFVEQPVIDACMLAAAHASEIWDLEDDTDDLTRTELVDSVVSLLSRATATRAAVTGTLALDRLLQVRDLLIATPTRRHSTAELERVCGLDRWTLARQFRAAFGTSPSRFRTLRQLQLARRLIERGSSLARAAIDAGFADQSHLSRQFKRAYGLTPARWAAALV